MLMSKNTAKVNILWSKTGKSQIRLFCFASTWFSVLRRGVSSANFQVVGNKHDSTVVLITKVITGTMGVSGSPFKLNRNPVDSWCFV